MMVKLPAEQLAKEVICSSTGNHARRREASRLAGLCWYYHSLVINSTISFIEENNAGNVVAALMARLAPKAKVLRDGRWGEQDAAILVPGDIISIKLGDIVPVDARLLEGDPLKIDQGELEAVVIATGVHTFFGKAAHLVDTTNQVGHFQQVLTAIGNFCICSIAVGMLIEIVVMYPIRNEHIVLGLMTFLCCSLVESQLLQHEKDKFQLLLNLFDSVYCPLIFDVLFVFLLTANCFCVLVHVIHWCYLGLCFCDNF